MSALPPCAPSDGDKPAAPVPSALRAGAGTQPQLLSGGRVREGAQCPQSAGRLQQPRLHRGRKRPDSVTQDGAADDPETDGCGWAGQRHPSSQNYLGGVCWRGLLDLACPGLHEGVGSHGQHLREESSRLSKFQASGFSFQKIVTCNSKETLRETPWERARQGRSGPARR